MSFFTALISSKVAAGALAAGTLAVGGTTAAAYAGSLPEQLQQTAHEVIGAPAPATAAAKDAAKSAKKEAEATAGKAKAEATSAAGEATDAVKKAVDSLPAGPDLTGPAAIGLCNAFAHGGLDANSTSYKSLAVAAKGSANITAYCQTVGAPGAEQANGKASVGADVNGEGAAKANVPSVPALPSEAAVPSAPALPSKAADNVSELPTTAPRQ
jgi:hypothetical protein